MSEARSRKGGIFRFTTLRRNSRSSRNFPSRTASVKVAVGGGDDADVDRHRLAAADAVDQPLLDGTQELGLQPHVHLGNFVEQQRAAVRFLELADARAPVRR